MIACFSVSLQISSKWIFNKQQIQEIPSKYVCVNKCWINIQVINWIRFQLNTNESNTKMATNNEAPDPQLLEMLRVITGLDNMSENELNKPILRSTIQDTYILYIIQYALLSFIGVVANIWIIYYISRHKLYRDNTHAFFINLSVCHFVQSAFVVPITLVTTIVHNWILGQFMCFFVPMLQVRFKPSFV